MKHLLLTTIAAVLVVGCGESQQSAPQSEPVEPIAEAAKPEPPTAKAPAISIHDAVEKGNVEAIKQHLAAGTDVNARDSIGETPLFYAAVDGHKEIAELLIAEGADVNVRGKIRTTPLQAAAMLSHKEIVELLIDAGADVNVKDLLGETPLDWADDGIALLLREHGAKTAEELDTEGK